jgi:hypothetical protein
MVRKGSSVRVRFRALGQEAANRVFTKKDQVFVTGQDASRWLVRS